MTLPDGRPPLLEKDFVHEGYKQNPWPAWLWLVLAAIAAAMLWGIGNWYADKINIVFKDNPFLQVKNRDISLFLWQNPEYMRINAKEKGNYLPGFNYLDKVTVDLAYADQYAVAPPELLFRYHTWNRLLKQEFTERPIPIKDFRDFLSYVEEWKPEFWPDAPKGYVELIKTLPEEKVEDLSTLSREQLPLDVRIAFQGWENYFKDKEAINKIKVTRKQLQEFLESHPHYARNYWQNIVPNYLKGRGEDDSEIPAGDFTPFLRTALFNYIK